MKTVDKDHDDEASHDVLEKTQATLGGIYRIGLLIFSSTPRLRSTSDSLEPSENDSNICCALTLHRQVIANQSFHEWRWSRLIPFLATRPILDANYWVGPKALAPRPT